MCLSNLALDCMPWVQGVQPNPHLLGEHIPSRAAHVQPCYPHILMLCRCLLGMQARPPVPQPQRKPMPKL